MPSLRTMKNLVTGMIGPDEIAEMLSQMGMEASMATVAEADVPATFRAAFETASLPHGKLVVVDVRMKSGDRMRALLVTVAEKTS